MALTYRWDQRSDHRVRFTRLNGAEIRRGCLITGLTNVNQATGTDPEAFLRVLADPDCPQVGSYYPTTVSPFNTAILEEILPETAGPAQANNSVRVIFVYRITPVNNGENVWTVTEGGQGSYVDVWGTALGSYALTVLYRKNFTSTYTAAVYPPLSNPSPIIRNVRNVHRFYPQRTLRVTGQLYAEDWYAVRNAIRAAAGKINSDTWGADTRGKWLFLYPISRTADLGRTFFIELHFLMEKNGHFPFGIYIDPQGSHPADSGTQGQLIADGLPAYDSFKGRNGIIRASVYEEIDFSPLFAFTPDDVPLDPTNPQNLKKAIADARHAQ